MERKRRPLVAAGLVLGLGLGGFVDGILFHQILQLHNMLSARVPNTDLVGLEVNMVWDGLFHLFTLVMTTVGVFMLFGAARHADIHWSRQVLVGAMLQGWGIFNFVEGLIDHYMLQVHHVVERLGLSWYDHLFLLSGLVFFGLGYWLTRTARKETGAAPSAPLSRARI